MRERPALSRQCRLCTGDPVLYKAENWESHGEQANKQCSSMTSASVPASRFLPWIFSMDCDCRHVSQVTFLLTFFLVIVFTISHKMVPKEHVWTLLALDGLAFWERWSSSCRRKFKAAVWSGLADPLAAWKRPLWEGTGDGLWEDALSWTESRATLHRGQPPQE